MNGESLLPIKREDINSAIKLKTCSYERLEFIGDAVIRLILSLYLFFRFPNDREGFLTKLRAELENASTLSVLAKKLDLQKYILLSRNHEIFGSRDINQKIQCDLYESFIGALFLDVCKIKHDEILVDKIDIEIMLLLQNNGFGVCYKFMKNMIEKEINIPQILKNNINYKDELLRAYHKLNWQDPKYGTKEKLEDKNNMGKQHFIMYVRDPDNNIIGEGIGTSKRKGEKKAAKNAYKFLKKEHSVTLGEDSDDDEKEVILSPRNSLINTRTKNNKLKSIISEMSDDEDEDEDEDDNDNELMSDMNECFTDSDEISH